MSAIFRFVKSDTVSFGTEHDGNQAHVVLRRGRDQIVARTGSGSGFHAVSVGFVLHSRRLRFG